MMRDEILLALFRIVLSLLNRMAQRTITTRNDALHKMGRRIESRRTLGCIQHAQPARRARTAVEKMTASFETIGDGVNRLGDVRQFPLNGERHFLIGSIDDAQHVNGGERINASRGWVLGFS
jgi:hypothetical protein